RRHTRWPRDWSSDVCSSDLTVLIAQLMGIRRKTTAPGTSDTPSDMYAIPHRRHTAEVVSLPLIWETPLRTGNLRDPNGPQVTFEIGRASCRERGEMWVVDVA